MFNDSWKVCATVCSDEMPIDVLEAFNFVIDNWGVNRDIGLYIGWTLCNLNFDKEFPDSIEINKMIVDDWLVSFVGVPDKEDTTVLIKYRD